MAKNILIIEDEKSVSDMYKTHLENKGYQIAVSSNGKEGMELAKKEKPDLILLDIILPQKDGFTVLGKLKADKSTKKIPIVLLTNLGQDDDKKRGKDLGARDYLIKANLTPSQIGEKIKEYLK